MNLKPVPPQRHFVYNNKIFEPEKDLLNIEIDDLLTKNIIVPSKMETGEFLSPIFTVPKPECNIQMILNLKYLNVYIKYIHFKMDNIRTVLLNITPDCFMASLDLKEFLLGTLGQIFKHI